VNNYWEKKGTCLFKNCNFGERHNSLNIERLHVKEYFENTLHLEDITEEQITIFLALNSIWKLLILERIYEEVDWRTPEPKEILDIERNAEIYEDVTGEERQEVLEYGNDEVVPPELEAEREEEKSRTMRNRKSMKSMYTAKNAKKVVDKRKIREDNIEKLNKKKFTADQAKVNKRRRNVIENKKENKVARNLSGYKWIFADQEKDKEHSEEEVYNAIKWCENMEYNLRKLDPVRKLKMLFDKWVIIQNQETNMKIKVQMEAISIAYDLKEFDIMIRIAKLNVSKCVGGETVNPPSSEV
jgi:hypothetical protein